MSNNNHRQLSSPERSELLKKLHMRFVNNRHRHPGIEWMEVSARLEENPVVLWSLSEMERTGGEPDVLIADTMNGRFLFVDCSNESPAGRRSLCYDRQAQESRKEHSPANNVMDMAAAMGIELMTEDAYRLLQTFGAFDTKTSSWIKTPDPIRRLGGALFCDRRYNTVFVYHNGASSYYTARGFRGMLWV